ncbi:MAG: elongation factor Tu [Methanomicrobiales archaeon]|jgi:selenocysteine-specific translation elongation factor|nr:elongation factor Tu [Methanomicrobiales archaeon]
MPNLTIIYLGPSEIAKELAKKGTESDITFYNLKRANDTVTLVEPTRYPEKLSSLFFSAALSDAALLVIDEISAALGECIVMLNAAQVSSGYIILKNYIDETSIKPLIAGTVLENYSYVSEDLTALREQLLHDASLSSSASDGPAIIPIDHHFNVKGIGTVILGCIAKGTVKKHDQLLVWPTKKIAQVRSIQKHDDDADEAYQGDRVGLALKGVTADELDRGYVLAPDNALIAAEELHGKISLVPWWKQPLKEQMILYAGYWMQFAPCRVSAISGDETRSPMLTLICDRSFVFDQGAQIVLHYLEGERLRIVGTFQPEI